MVITCKNTDQSILKKPTLEVGQADFFGNILSFLFLFLPLTLSLYGSR